MKENAIIFSSHFPAIKLTAFHLRLLRGTLLLIYEVLISRIQMKWNFIITIWNSTVRYPCGENVLNKWSVWRRALNGSFPAPHIQHWETAMASILPCQNFLYTFFVCMGFSQTHDDWHLSYSSIRLSSAVFLFNIN